jgi:hypothetical protein
VDGECGFLEFLETDVYIAVDRSLGDSCLGRVRMGKPLYLVCLVYRVYLLIMISYSLRFISNK